VDFIAAMGEAWEAFIRKGDATLVDQLFAEDYVRHGSTDSDREGFKLIMHALHTAFPDLETRPLDVIEQGDRVVYRWESRGTHQGEYLGAPATGKSIVARGITITRLADGRAVEDWSSWNEVSVLHQLGILPIDR